MVQPPPVPAPSLARYACKSLPAISYRCRSGATAGTLVPSAGAGGGAQGTNMLQASPSRYGVELEGIREEGAWLLAGIRGAGERQKCLPTAAAASLASRELHGKSLLEERAPTLSALYSQTSRARRRAASEFAACLGPAGEAASPLLASTAAQAPHFLPCCCPQAHSPPCRAPWSWHPSPLPFSAPSSPSAASPRCKR